MHSSGQFAQGCGARDGVRSPKVGGNPNVVARHARGVGKEKERPRHQGGIEEIHARTAKDLLADDDRKGHSQSKLPKRRGDRHNHRDDEARDEETFVHLMVTNLRKGKFDAQANNIGYR